MDGFDDGGGPCPSWGGRRCGGREAAPFVLGMLEDEGICERMVGATFSTTGEVIAGVGRADGVGELLLSVIGSRDNEKEELDGLLVSDNGEGLGSGLTS